MDTDAILQHCLAYQNEENKVEIELYNENFLEKKKGKSYFGQGSDPDPLKRPRDHKKNRKDLY